MLASGSVARATSAEAASQVTNPCSRLSSGQSKYSGFSANRVTFATTTDRGQTRALVTTCVRAGNSYQQEWQSAGYVGRSGFKAPGVPSGHTQYEFSPTGSYSVTEGFGLWNPGTRLRFQVLNRNSRWGGRPNSNYNRYFESSSDIWPDENMWSFATRPTGDYRQGVVINYNRPPDSSIRAGEGFAIFLHSNPEPTAGCISLPESVVTRYLRNAQPGDRIIMGAVDDIFTPYSSNPFGSITQKYAQLGGQVVLGNPISNETGGLPGGGAYQDFQRGSIVWSPAGGAHLSDGAIRDAWQRSGFERGALGYPTSDTIALRFGGSYQNYQGGAIIYSPATGAQPSFGPIRGAYQQSGFENGPLGYPTTGVVSLPGGGSYQNYQGGAIVYSPSSGAWASTGTIRTAWARLGFEQGILGYPTSNETRGLKDGGTYQNYQGGAIIYSPATGAQPSFGPIRGAYQQSGFENGPLGYPTTGVVSLPGGGSYQNYQGGAIVYSPSSGAWASTGTIRTAWARLGFEQGILGYPTSNETRGLKDGGTYQNYQGGAIIYSPATGAQPSFGPIRGAYQQSGFENGPLGYPTTGVVSLPGGGSYQNYQGGAIVSSVAGTYGTWGPIRAAWGKEGFERGPLGYPTSGQYESSPGVTAQDFQGGLITTSATGTTVSLNP
ncbi:hypothetical protein B8W73_11955 [Arthrobacter agilis]|nr:hypothetical protein B8W73_11955 [Arthrobacter agilis]